MIELRGSKGSKNLKCGLNTMRTDTVRTAESFAMLLLLAITFSVGSAQAAADANPSDNHGHGSLSEVSHKLSDPVSRQKQLDSWVV